MNSNDVPEFMQGVYLTGHGGFDKLEFRTDIPVPTLADDEVLVKVGGAGINNTDINTRTAWYSKKVTDGTGSGGEAGFDSAEGEDGSWGGNQLSFPRIQGADCAGTIVAVGSQVDQNRLGERVLVRAMMDESTPEQPLKSNCTGSECDGGFAQYMSAPSRHTLKINSDWTDIELASVPCAYSTAEGMLHRANVVAETVLVTGASGGVGSAAVQLAKRRGAQVIAMSSASKAESVLALGADKVIDRNADVAAELGENSVDVVVDLVAGEGWPALLNILKVGGRYVTSGAIAGPIVELDVRTLYLKDLTFYGSTYQPEEVFENLVGYIERNEIKPVVAKVFPLNEIVAAQQAFLSKQFTGKLVLQPEQ